MREKILKYMQLTGLSTWLDILINEFVKQFNEELAPTFSAPLTATNIFEKALREDIPKLIENVVDIYEKHFSEEDIDIITAFQESPTGRRMTEMGPSLQETLYAVRNTWRNASAERIGPDLAKLIENNTPEEIAETKTDLPVETKP